MAVSQWSPTEIGVLVSLCGASLASIIFTIQKSKCKTIKMCGAECERDVSMIHHDTTDPPDLEAQHAIQPPMPPITHARVEQTLSRIITPHHGNTAEKIRQYEERRTV